MTLIDARKLKSLCTAKAHNALAPAHRQRIVRHLAGSGGSLADVVAIIRAHAAPEEAKFVNACVAEPKNPNPKNRK